jgi:hypothetical protein
VDQVLRGDGQHRGPGGDQPDEDEDDVVSRSRVTPLVELLLLRFLTQAALAFARAMRSDLPSAISRS